jgi:hypothetical protein
VPRRRDTFRLVPGGLLLASAASKAASPTVTMTAAVSSAELPNETKRTRIGDLSYEAGFPTADTVKKLYDEFDFQRAVLAYQYAEPLVAMHGLNVGLKQIGGREGDIYELQRFLDPHGIALTGNSTTIYAMSFLDLRNGGPMVVEVTTGSYGAFFDLWQQTIAGVGPVGADKGKGGKFLVLPVDFKDPFPRGTTRSSRGLPWLRILRAASCAMATLPQPQTALKRPASIRWRGGTTPRRPTFSSAPAKPLIRFRPKVMTIGSVSRRSSTT